MFSALGNPIVAALSVAIVWVLIDDHLGSRYGVLVPAAVVAMGPLRALDGAHWPSDVLAGYALGLAWTITVLVIVLPWAAGQRQMENHPAQPDTEAGFEGRIRAGP